MALPGTFFYRKGVESEWILQTTRDKCTAEMLKFLQDSVLKLLSEAQDPSGTVQECQGWETHIERILI